MALTATVNRCATQNQKAFSPTEPSTQLAYFPYSHLPYNRFSYNQW